MVNTSVKSIRGKGNIAVVSRKKSERMSFVQVDYKLTYFTCRNWLSAGTT